MERESEVPVDFLELNGCTRYNWFINEFIGNSYYFTWNWLIDIAG